MARPCVKIQLTERLGILSAKRASNSSTARASCGGTSARPHLGSLISQLPEVSIITSKPKPNLFLSWNSAFHPSELFWSEIMLASLDVALRPASFCVCGRVP